MFQNSVEFWCYSLLHADSKSNMETLEPAILTWDNIIILSLELVYGS
jgi:hypothetical protein